MSSVAEITARLVEEGVPPEEAAQLAAQYALRQRPAQAPDSRVDGAPSLDLGTDPQLSPQRAPAREIDGLTPPTYLQSLENETNRMAGGGGVMQMRGDPGYEDQVRIETYQPGMSQDELDFAEARREGVSRFARMGATGEIHPQQEWGYNGSDGMAMWLRHRDEDQRDAAERERTGAFRNARASLSSAPGPRDISGIAAPPRSFATVEESQDYDLRKPIRNEAGDVVGVMPSQRDIDMHQRGYVPVYGDDGSVSYGIAAGDVRALQQNQGDGVLGGFNAGMRGGVGRLGPRPDLEEAGWELQSAPSPFGGEFGTVPVYRQSEELREGFDAQKQQRALVRLAGQAGISYEDAMEYMAGMAGDEAEKTAATMQWLRARGQEASQDDKRQRGRRVQMNAMLSGPNAGRNLTNAFDMLGSPGDFGLTQNQQRALQYMLPGGQLAAEVESRQLQSAQEIATSALRGTLGNALMAGGLGGAGGAAPADVGAMAYEQTQRGNLTHPSVIAYAKQYYETNWSFTGRDRVEKTIDHLTLTLPGMDEPTARRIAESF
jgi:hypothetical protein